MMDTVARVARFWALAIMLGACGARTDLDDGEGNGNHVFPLEAHCIVEGGGTTAPGVPVAIEARSQGGRDPSFLGWQVQAAPGGSRAEPENGLAERTLFEPDITGGYRLRATFVEGTEQASCTIEIQARSRPTVDCGDESVSTPAGTNVLLAVVAAGAAPLRYSWRVEERPPGSVATPVPDDEPATAFRPDSAGRYVVGVEVRDRFDATASCRVEVIATPDPPRLECDDAETQPLRPVHLSARYLGEGTPSRWEWTAQSMPEGSSASPPSPDDEPEPSFTPDLAGSYLLRVAVTNDRGEVFDCVLTVEAVATEELRIEMFWNPPDRSCDEAPGRGCDDSDVDLHLLHPDGTAWFNATFDCYWRNCVGGLSWDDPGDEDDPFLDLDDREGFGPENINVQAPADGTFRIGVHYYSDGDDWDAPSEVTVRVYCGDGEPTLAGPRMLSADDARTSRNDFWKVADVTFDRGACSLRILDDVVTTIDAQNAR